MAQKWSDSWRILGRVATMFTPSLPPRRQISAPLEARQGWLSDPANRLPSTTFTADSRAATIGRDISGIKAAVGRGGAVPPDGAPKAAAAVLHPVGHLPSAARQTDDLKPKLFANRVSVELAHPQPVSVQARNVSRLQSAALLDEARHLAVEETLATLEGSRGLGAHALPSWPSTSPVGETGRRVRRLGTRTIGIDAAKLDGVREPTFSEALADLNAGRVPGRVPSWLASQPPGSHLSVSTAGSKSRDSISTDDGGSAIDGHGPGRVPSQLSPPLPGSRFSVSAAGRMSRDSTSAEDGRSSTASPDYSTRPSSVALSIASAAASDGSLPEIHGVEPNPTAMQGVVVPMTSLRPTLIEIPASGRFPGTGIGETSSTAANTMGGHVAVQTQTLLPLRYERKIAATPQSSRGTPLNERDRDRDSCSDGGR